MRHLFAIFLLLAALFLLDMPPPLSVAQANTGLPSQRTDPRQSLAIIVNRSNPINNLSFSELRKIFNGERSRWPNGHRVTLTMLANGFEERAVMLREVYQMSEKEYREHFLKGNYTGEIPVAPKTLSSPEILRKFVFNAPGAIGYVRASDVDESVKVVRIDGRLPNEPEYKLQFEGQGN